MCVKVGVCGKVENIDPAPNIPNVQFIIIIINLMLPRR